uniref:hypothetical protein n=1 Tax=Halosiphon tomentosus TaxID=64927 RepID=UPI002E79914D|nr:hypothetical protein V2488_pgp045 [Halosiphon tomentosus]WAM63776.1 hypothetical protein [Halosiphon tomentosus]
MAVSIPKPLTTYHFIIASDKFLKIDEPLEEILRERVQHYRRVEKPNDFWFLSAPEFLESKQLDELRNKLSDANLSKTNCSAIVSTNKIFITWLKLRLNNVAIGNFIAPIEDIPSPLISSFKGIGVAK